MEPDLPAPALGYPSAKREILGLVKRRPGVSLTELGRALGISKAATLAHLTALEADGLLARSYRAGQVGRPPVVFHLTAGAQSLFPQGYSEMSVCALEFIERRLGREGVVQLLQERAHDLEDRNEARFRGKSLPERVSELVRMRTEGGYIAERGRRGRSGHEVLEHNCPILAIAERFPEACQAEQRMFATLLKADVDARHRMAAGDPICRFVIRPLGRSDSA